MLQSLLELNNYLNTYQNLLEKEINEFKIGDDHHRALTTIRRLLKGLNFWVVDKINNLENDYLNSENKDSDERSSEIMQVIDDFNRKIIERLNKLRIEENLVDSDINEDIFMMDKLKNIREDFSNFYKSLKPKDVDLSFDKIELNNKLEKKIKIFSQRANVIEKNISNIENNYAEILDSLAIKYIYLETEKSNSFSMSEKKEFDSLFNLVKLVVFVSVVEINTLNSSIPYSSSPAFA